ncbi:unnamed protein product, partial [Meganyctiphanes norvegica]
MGFRAFGDVLPGSASSGDGTGPRDVYKLLGRPVIILGTSAVNASPKEASNIRSSKKIEVNLSGLGSDVQLATSSSHVLPSSGVNVQLEKSDFLAGIKNVSSKIPMETSNIPVTKININLDNKSLHSTLNNLSKDKIHTLDRSSLGVSLLGSKSEKINKNLNSNSDKDSSKLSIINNNQPIFLMDKTNAENLTFPQLISGSRFILVGHKIFPTQQKMRIGSFPLTPQPVPIIGKEPPVIMGLHSSGSKAGTPKNLMPIALLLKQTFPHDFLPSKENKGQTKTANNGPTPRPRKVTGKLNLDNFFRPAVNHQTTPRPFQLPEPSKQIDYQYSDYYYYDYVDSARLSGSSGGPLAKDHQDVTKPKSNQRKNRSEEDLDFSDSYEDN